MDARFFERLEAIRDRCNYGLIEIATNALLLNGERSRKLIRILTGVSHEIWISFHGFDKKSYEMVMGIPFEKTYANILNFLKQCDEDNPDMRVVIRGAGLPKLKKWGMRNFFTETQYQNFWHDSFERSSIRIRPRIEFFRYHDRAANVKKFGLNFRQSPRQDLSSIHCPRVDGWLHFLYNGELILCCMDYHRETVFGDIRKHTLEEILAGRAFSNLRGKALGESPSPKNFICRRCFSPGG
jgi:hypothetical protein